MCSGKAASMEPISELPSTVAEDEEQALEDDPDAPAHYPSAPPDELFDISTTVDPSYVISLIRRLLPVDARKDSTSRGPEAAFADIQGQDADHMEENAPLVCKDEKMEMVDGFNESDGRGGEDDHSYRVLEQSHVLEGEYVWEECGCVLWDLAASKTHAELMVQNLILEVLLANLVVTQSTRVTEICLGIMGNLACHEILRKDIASTNGLITVIVDQLFIDDTQCLCEACRLLTLALQGSECIAWAKALQSEQVLGRILWITENTLNPQLIENIIGLLLSILESQQEVQSILVPSLMKLGLPNLLVNLLAFEMSKLTNERIPERYSALDVILHAIEAVSVMDNYSQKICTNKELFRLVCDLVKFSDKSEVASSCVTAGVLIANILADAADLASEITQDLPFLQGLFDILPIASDDLEARSALWSIISRLLGQLQEDDVSASSLCEYVSVIGSKAEVIEDDLLDQRSDETKSLSTCHTKPNARSIALRRMITIIEKWNASKDNVNEIVVGENYSSDGSISRLLYCCRKFTE